MQKAAASIRTKSGKIFDRWKNGIINALTVKG